jgi:3-dehydroquinate dehydratase/shikimate dehydrogenase
MPFAREALAYLRRHPDFAAMTLVAVPLSAADPQTLLADTRRAQTAGADVVEWRLDTCLKLGADLATIIAAIPQAALPVLATLRDHSERGDWQGSPAERDRWLTAADAAGAAYIDIELATLTAWRPATARLILSSHDFTGIGHDLPGKIAAMRAAGGLPKIAITARDAADLALIHDLLAATPAGSDLIALAMGEHGLPSRLLAGVWGGFLTFARLGDQAGSAPGQPTVGDLLGIYRLKTQRRDWKVLGVIGSPIAHSLSPHIHNAALAANGIPAVYVPFRVEDAPAFWAACGGWIAGLSITIPHKQALQPAMATLAPLAKAIGAMNTIVHSTTTVGANTDAGAIIACVEGAAGTLTGKTVLCLGAGGVGRAIAHALASRGAKIVIANRTAERATELAAEVGGQAVAWDAATGVAYDVLVNGTAQGMGKPDESPWPAAAHRPGTVVFDTVYVPLETRLLREAKAAGATVVAGLDMFILQAADQYGRFTGQAAPQDLMRATALGRLTALPAKEDS